MSEENKKAKKAPAVVGASEEKKSEVKASGRPAKPWLETIKAKKENK